MARRSIRGLTVSGSTDPDEDASPFAVLKEVETLRFVSLVPTSERLLNDRLNLR